MYPLSIMAFFCEDIREEKGDIFTLIGILPDTVRLQEQGSGVVESGEPVRLLLPRLCIYVRINFDPAMDLGPTDISLVLPSGERLAIGRVGQDIIDRSRTEAKARGNLLSGVVSRAVIGGFRPPEGAIKVEVNIQGDIYLAGALMFSHPSATAPSPPA